MNATTTSIQVARERMGWAREEATLGYGWSIINKLWEICRSQIMDQGFSDFNVHTNHMGMDLFKAKILIK